MKFSIERHKECLKNSKSYLESLKKEIESAQARYNRTAASIAFYEIQIATAEEEGKNEFDSEKFMVKRNKK